MSTAALIATCQAPYRAPLLALSIGNYSEARLLASRELYRVFILALPISLLQPVTLTVGHTRRLRVPLSLSSDTNNGLIRSRERIIQVLCVKKRLNERRKVTIVNQTASCAKPPD